MQLIPKLVFATVGAHVHHRRMHVLRKYAVVLVLRGVLTRKLQQGFTGERAGYLNLEKLCAPGCWTPEVLVDCGDFW